MLAQRGGRIDPFATAPENRLTHWFCVFPGPGARITVYVPCNTWGGPVVKRARASWWSIKMTSCSMTRPPTSCECCVSFMPLDGVPHRLTLPIESLRTLAVLASRMPWQEIEASPAHPLSRQFRRMRRRIIRQRMILARFARRSVAAPAAQDPATRRRQPSRRPPPAVRISRCFALASGDGNDRVQPRGWCATPIKREADGSAGGR